MSAPDILKKCGGECGRELPADRFALKNAESGVRQPRCRDCVKAYSKRHYEANKGVYIERAKKSQQELREQCRAIAADRRKSPCVDCGLSFPSCCMEFDHRQGREIRGRASDQAISNLKNRATSLTQFLREIEKCDVVCANCHNIRTWNRGENPRWAMGGMGIEPMLADFQPAALPTELSPRESSTTVKRPEKDVDDVSFCERSTFGSGVQDFQLSGHEE